MQPQGLQVAIDGPASAGKSTVAKIVARKFAYVYVDTGAMYRTVTLRALQAHVDLTNETEVLAVLQHTKITFTPGNPVQHVFANQDEVTEEIRSETVTNHVSTVSALPAIRAALVKRQQELAKAGGIVMDGRDIGTTVLPHAAVKVFLVASVKERAERRYLENQAKGITTSLKTLQQEIAERDYKDSHRTVSPLRKAPDATEIDTTALSIDEVVDRIADLIRQKQDLTQK
ncbi:(d)CMP kinase [Fructilactobacillus myrtifloralis]|uniref:Cytidylate kinase n=1 Tax=Fructilactobacillus myrtifloralis TaxID=2940301 RepID=A0ABY5BSM7_9LACO|nr:(d)CMP kinase [Fructilactobacillus myrtifloralis]USS85374.1 (d)CMP kinase [Fructilactobacillus myrtifloralis]